MHLVYLLVNLYIMLLICMSLLYFLYVDVFACFTYFCRYLIFNVFLVELNIVDTLYRMLRDKDPYVVLNSASALNEMLAGEGGMVVNRNIAHYLLSRFDHLVTIYSIIVVP